MVSFIWTICYLSVLVGLSAGCILFGLVWSMFLVLFGAGMLLVSLARLGLELRAERRARRRLAPGARR